MWLFETLKVLIIAVFISLISKNEAINLLQNDDLTEKPEHYKVNEHKNF